MRIIPSSGISGVTPFPHQVAHVLPALFRIAVFVSHGPGFSPPTAVQDSRCPSHATSRFLPRTLGRCRRFRNATMRSVAGFNPLCGFDNLTDCSRTRNAAVRSANHVHVGAADRTGVSHMWITEQVMWLTKQVVRFSITEGVCPDHHLMGPIIFPPPGGLFTY